MIMSSGPILDAPPIYVKLELTEVGLNVMIQNKYLQVTNDDGSWARAWCYFFSGDVSWQDQMLFRMSMIRFCWDVSDHTKWVEKIVVHENDEDKDFESSNFDPLSAQPAKEYRAPMGYVYVPDKLEDDVPMPPATK